MFFTTEVSHYKPWTQFFSLKYLNVKYQCSPNVSLQKKTVEAIFDSDLGSIKSTVHPSPMCNITAQFVARFLPWRAIFAHTPWLRKKRMMCPAPVSPYDPYKAVSRPNVGRSCRLYEVVSSLRSHYVLCPVILLPLA